MSGRPSRAQRGAVPLVGRQLRQRIGESAAVCRNEIHHDSFSD
jgi:hypothetical protein